jgi:hypothetical protein
MELARLEDPIRAQRAASLGWPLAYWYRFEAFESAFGDECAALAIMYRTKDPATRLAAIKAAELAKIRRDSASIHAFAAIAKFSRN